MKMNFKQNNIKLAIAAGLVIGSAGLTAPAFAEDEVAAPPSVTGQMEVTARIGVACTVTTDDIAFGLYDAVVTNKDDDLRATTPGRIKQTCTIGSSGTINIDAGKYAGADGVSNRQMKTLESVSDDQVAYLNYSVHVADNISSADWPASDGPAYTGTGSEVITNVYAFVPKNQNKAVKGAYSDELTITITY